MKKRRGKFLSFIMTLMKSTFLQLPCSELQKCTFFKSTFTEVKTSSDITKAVLAEFQYKLKVA